MIRRGTYFPKQAHSKSLRGIDAHLIARQYVYTIITPRAKILPFDWFRVRHMICLILTRSHDRQLDIRSIYSKALSGYFAVKE